MSWYRTGKVAVTAGSTLVIGSQGADFRAVEPGWALVLQGSDRLHEIAKGEPPAGGVCRLHLQQPWDGLTATDLAYAIIPNAGGLHDAVEALTRYGAMTQSLFDVFDAFGSDMGTVTYTDAYGVERTIRTIRQMEADAAALVDGLGDFNQAVTDSQAARNEARAWASKTDGPVVDGEHSAKWWAQQAESVVANEAASAAALATATAQQAATDAVSARNQAQTHRNAAETAALASGAARDDAVTARDDASAQRAAADVARTAAQGDASTASAASLTAVAARDTATTQASLAQAYAQHALDVPIPGVGGYSALHHAARAEYWAGQAASAANVGPATDTTAGLVERATQAEVNTGTDAERYVTPATLAQRLSTFSTVTSWTQLQDKPLSFPPSAHGHGMAEIGGLADALAAKLDTTNFSWGTLPGKPVSFPAAAHGHAIADVTGLTAALGNKLDASAFTWNALPDKPASFPAAAHDHDDRYPTDAEVSALLAGVGGGRVLKISGAAEVPLSGADVFVFDTAGSVVTGRLPAIDVASPRSIALVRAGNNAADALAQAGQTIEGADNHLRLDADRQVVILAPDSATNWRVLNKSWSPVAGAVAASVDWTNVTNRPVVIAAFAHTQASPAAVWTVNHNLGRYPAVTVLSVGGLEVCAEIAHLSLNQLEVRFATAFAGTARCL